MTGVESLIIHRLTPDGASFTQEPENFIRIHQITDVDTDHQEDYMLGHGQERGTKESRQRLGRKNCSKNWVYKPFLKLLQGPIRNSLNYFGQKAQRQD